MALLQQTKGGKARELVSPEVFEIQQHSEGSLPEAFSREQSVWVAQRISAYVGFGAKMRSGHICLLNNRVHVRLAGVHVNIFYNNMRTTSKLH